MPVLGSKTPHKAANPYFRRQLFHDIGIERRKSGGFQAALCDMSLEI
jgi:hypothetical protein